MKRVLILYGWHGSDAPHWQDWLATTLRSEGYEVSFPQLSDKMSPDKDVWVKEAQQAFDVLQPDMVIAHSLGNILWMHLCALGHIKQVKKLLVVAPPRDLSDYEAVRGFFPVPNISSLCAQDVTMIVSDNDPYMSLAEADAFASKLGCHYEVLKNGGHINSESGFGAWPWVLEWVKGNNDA